LGVSGVLKVKKGVKKKDLYLREIQGKKTGLKIEVSGTSKGI